MLQKNQVKWYYALKKFIIFVIQEKNRDLLNNETF